MNEYLLGHIMQMPRRHRSHTRVNVPCCEPCSRRQQRELILCLQSCWSPES